MSLLRWCIPLVLLVAAVACRPAADLARTGGTGRDLYRMNCASCHGESARGDGPVAPLIKVPVPDLTRIAERRGGTFPDLEIFRIIDGQAPLEAHGPRHMPVWGYEFFGEDADDRVAHAQATERVDRLVRYLQSVQRPPQPAARE